LHEVWIADRHRRHVHRHRSGRFPRRPDRLPQGAVEREGGLRAEFAANFVGVQRVASLFETYGDEVAERRRRLSQG